MKKLLILLALALTAKISISQIVISGFFANPPSTDGNYEYIQLVATQNINFATTPYTVVVSNNGTATSKGWVNGSFVTTGFLLNSGTVNQGDVFYVGGSGKLIYGAGSTDISSLTWIRTIDFSSNSGDIVGSGNTTSGVLGNGGTADGIAVFSGQLSATDSTVNPIDAVFYGTSIGNAVGVGKGYPIADNDLYSISQGLFGEGTNTFLASGGSTSEFVKLSGTYNTSSNTWTTARTSSLTSLTATSVAADIASQITLGSSNPTITINPAGFTNDFGLTYPGVPSSGSNFTISGTNLTDTVFVTTRAPFETRVGSNAFATDVVKLVPTGGTLSTLFLDVRFNPSGLGVFEDTIFISSAGATTQMVLVKGTASNSPEISFNVGSVTVNEGAGTVSVQVNITNANSTATTIDLVRLSGTATAGTDYTWTSPQMLTFPANSSDSIVINISITDDNQVEASETLWLGFANATNGAVLGVIDSMLITITDNDYLPVNIGPITTVNANGVLDSLNGRYDVTGVVYGGNVKTSANGFQFTIRDNTGGVTVFSNAKTFGYTVTQGDSIRVKGTIVQFNGLAEMSFVDTIIVLATGRPISAPRVTTALGETEENDLVRFNNATVKPGVWASGNQYVYLNNGADSIQVRIVPNTNSLIGKQRPATAFSIIGIGGQFDNSSPYTSGYQLFPRDTNDIIPTPDTLSSFNLLTPASGTIDTIQGANTQVITATWEPANPAPGINIPTYEVLIDLPTGDFSTPLAVIQSNVAGTQASASLQYLTLVNLMNAQGLSGGQSLSLQWTVRATTGSYSRLANTPFTITLVRGVMAGVNNAEAVMSVYPNPANGTVYVEMPELINTITISTAEGKTVTSQQPTAGKTSLDVTGLNTGIYLISVETASGVYTQRLAIQR